MLFALRRLAITAPLLVVVSLLVFLIGSFLPGDPSAARFDVHGGAEARANWRVTHGLDEWSVLTGTAAIERAEAEGLRIRQAGPDGEDFPADLTPAQAREIAKTDPAAVRVRVAVPLAVPSRYLRYMRGVLTRFDFGQSFTDDRDIGPELVDKFCGTLELTLFALILAVPIGVGVGVLGAVKRGRSVDYLVNLLAVFGNSIPIFWLGMVMILVAISVGYRHFNGRIDQAAFEGVVGAYRTKLYLFESLFRGEFRVAWNCVQHLLIPALALSTIPMAVITRMTRSAVLEEIRKDYVQTARAKGLRPFSVVARHVLRNALVPIVTVTGTQTGSLLAGAVLTESIFDWRGLGTFVLEAVRRKDSPALVGGILLIATVFILVNLVVDLLYGVIDPRIRVSEG